VEIRTRRVQFSSHSDWRWHLDEMLARISGETHRLWRAVGREGGVLEVFATKRRDRTAAARFLERTMKRHGRPWSIVTDLLRSYGAAMNVIGNLGVGNVGVGSITGPKTQTSLFDDERARWPGSGTSRPSPKPPR
jgi:putative transposase